jgi:outer membrane immunogenic protein
MLSRIEWGDSTMKKFVLGILIALTSATSAVAADLYYKAPVAVPVYNWTGFYIGGNVGGAWGNFDPRAVTVYSEDGWFVPTDIPAIDAVGIQNGKATGFTGGFEAGYNWQSRNFVFGVEGDIEALSLSSRVSGSALYPGYPYTFTVTSNTGTTWLATVRGRLGYAVNNYLIFATGGAAFTDLHGSFAFFDNYGNAAGNPNAHESAFFSDTKTGYTIGGGVEAGLWGNWSVKGEYLYADFGTVSTSSNNLTAFSPALLFPQIAFPSNVFTHRFDLKANIARAALNYRF